MTAQVLKASKGKLLPANDRRGALQVWLVEASHNGSTVVAECLRKPESPAPSGAVELSQDEQGRWRAKLPMRTGGGGRSPEETKAIQRQHSQGMALQAMHEAAEYGHYSVTNIPDLDTFRGVITAWADWFDDDIKRGVER